MDGEVSFFSFNKKSDWEKGWAANLAISDEGLAVNNTRKYAVYKNITLERPDHASEVTDFAVGKPGQLYLLDDQAGIFIRDYKNERFELLFKLESLFSKHAILCFSGDTIYLADPFGEKKLAAVSASNGQILWSVDVYDGFPLLPLAIAVDGRQNVYALVPLDMAAGRAEDPEILSGGRLGVVKIDLTGKVVGLFQHKDCRLTRKTRVLHLRQRFFAAVAKDGVLYVLDSETKAIFGFTENECFFGQNPVFFDIKPSGLGIDSKNHIFIGDGRGIGPDAEDDRFILKLGLTDELPERISGYRGKVDKLLLDRNDRLYVWNKDTSTVTILELKQRILEMEATGRQHGIYISSSLDSTITEMQWHKFVMDARVPENTQIKVSYLASDRKMFTTNGKLTDLDEWIHDPAVPLAEKIKSLEFLWSRSVANPRDALLHGARGRYLWLKIELAGSEESTPLLKKIRVYFPRTSYLRYLPAVYQEDNESRDFLERFLSLFESFFSDMEEKIGHVARYFDADSVSGPLLRWLASWLAISVDESWSDEQLRRLVKKAPELYKKRGTKQGIEEMIEIYTGEKPLIVEYFQYKHLREEPELKDLVAQLYGTDPYRFCVLVRQECVPTARQRLAVQQILNQEKPAFTRAKLVVLQPWIYMDMHTYLGVNTYLSELSQPRLDQESSIPYNTVLIDVDLDNRMDIHTRIELGAEIK